MDGQAAGDVGPSGGTAGREEARSVGADGPAGDAGVASGAAGGRDPAVLPGGGPGGGGLLRGAGGGGRERVQGVDAPDAVDVCGAGLRVAVPVGGPREGGGRHQCELVPALPARAGDEAPGDRAGGARVVPPTGQRVRAALAVPGGTAGPVLRGKLHPVEPGSLGGVGARGDQEIGTCPGPSHLPTRAGAVRDRVLRQVRRPGRCSRPARHPIAAPGRQPQAARL